MRKFLKIFGITLASIVGLVVVAAGIVVYVVFTPNRITPIVQKVADEYIGCDYDLGQVDLTFFSTFPEFGLKTDGLLILNPTEGAQSDTLLYAEKVVARLDIQQLLESGVMDIREVTLENAAVNAYIAADGHTNFDILTLPEDTTEEDTTSDAFIKSLKMEDLRITLHASNISFVDEKDSITANLHEPLISLVTKQGEDSTLIEGKLQVEMPSLSANIGGEDYASDFDIRLDAPFVLQMEMPEFMNIIKAQIEFQKATLALNEFKVGINGTATVIPDINLNLDLSTNKWHISDVLKIVPASIFEMPKDIHADGDLAGEIHVEGMYNDSVWPLVDAQLALTKAEGSIDDLPYLLEDVQADVDAHIDLNNEKNCSAVIKAFSAKTKKSSFTATGNVTDLLNDIMLDICLKMDVHLPDAAYFLPDDMTADGHAQGVLNAKISLDDLADVRLQKGNIKADINFTNLLATMDEMKIRSPKGHLVFNIPNTKSKHRTTTFVNGTLDVNQLNVDEEGSLKAALGETSIALEASDVISSTDMIYADIALRTNALDGSIVMEDSAGNQTASVKAVQPTIKAYVEYNGKDEEAVPVADCSFAMKDLKALYDAYDVHVVNPSGSASIKAGKDKTQPCLAAKINADNLDATMEETADIKIGKAFIEAQAQHTNDTSSILLEWQPRLKLNLQNTVAQLENFDPRIKVPAIRFNYSNESFSIDTARVEIAHSDFNLSGNIDHIGDWLDGSGILSGELNFTSQQTDINELLAYISNMGSEDEDEDEAPAATTTATTSTSSDPIMVPKRMNVAIHTKMANAEAFGQKLNNLGGTIYINEDNVGNPQMIIEQVGFICEAANLQLSAMYKTPKKTDIFAGFDYHMMGVDIQKLVEMIPQVKEYVPMLDNFYGKVDFQLAGETRCNGNYDIKPSTTRAACSIVGTNLGVEDNTTFQKIAKLLSFARTDDFKIDSISTEINMYKNRVEIYPLLLTYRNWKAAVGGEHIVTNTNDLSNVQMQADYHVSLLSPLYIGVDVSGPMDDLNIKLSKKVYYAKDFSPIRHKDTENESANIRQMIKNALSKAIK